MLWIMPFNVFNGTPFKAWIMGCKFLVILKDCAADVLIVQFPPLQAILLIPAPFYRADMAGSIYYT